MLLEGNCVVAQSGGPTAVINASLNGVICEALRTQCIKNVYGALNGVVGIINDNLVDLSQEKISDIELLKNTPSSALGSCRHKLGDIETDPDFEKILNTFKKHNIRYFFYIGGNDSMDTADKLCKFFKRASYGIRVIGIPKTVDNDLFGTDHCPGFGSAAKYISTTVAEIQRDVTVYPAGQITIVEIMGRNAGWLTASSALANLAGSGPDLVCLPEVAFSSERFYKKVKDIHARTGKVLVCVSEGVKDKNGQYVSLTEGNSDRDAFGHARLGGVGAALKYLLSDIEQKIKVVELNVLQRSASHITSLTDLTSAVGVGKHAVHSASNGMSGSMVSIVRKVEPSTSFEFDLIPLSHVANKEKNIPAEWILEDGWGVTSNALDYMLPLIRGRGPFLEDRHGLVQMANLKLQKVS